MPDTPEEYQCRGDAADALWRELVRQATGKKETAVKPPPARHWQSYGTDPLPTGAEAIDQPFAAFPSWFLRVECDRCGKTVMHPEAHMSDRQRGIVLRVLLSRMRHDGCGGRAARAELLTGVEGVSSRPVRRIVLLGLSRW